MADNEEATLLVQVKASLSDFSAKMDEFNSIVGKSEEHTKALGSTWQDTMKGFLSAELIIETFKKLKEVIADCFVEADEDYQTTVKLTAAFGEGAAEIERYAQARGKLTRISEDDTKEAANNLHIYKLNREEILRLLPVIQDFAALKGRSAAETADAFGRAIEFGATRGLRQFGIEIEDGASQLDIFNALLKAGEGSVKGMAEQMGQAGLGPLEIFKNQIKEIQEDFGKKLLPDFAALVTEIGPGVLSFFEKVAGITAKSAQGIGAVAAMLGYMWGGKKPSEAFDLAAADLRARVSATSPEEFVGPRRPSGSSLGTTPVVGRGGAAKSDDMKKQFDAILDELEVYKSKSLTKLAEIDNALKSSKISIDQWYTQEAEVLSRVSAEEIEAQNRIIKSSKDAFEVQKARNAIAKAEEENKRKQIELSEKYSSMLERDNQLQRRRSDIGAAAQGRLLPNGATLEEQFAIEEAARKRQQAIELADYEALGASKAEIDDMANMHEMENAQRTFEFKRSLKEKELTVAANIAGQISSITNSLYMLSGQKSIALFNLNKVASIGEAEINGAVAATKAWKDYGWPYGAVLAVLIEAATQAQVAGIVAQQPPKMAKGGPINGPSHSAGGVMIEAEGGEYMFSGAAVRMYGSRAMDALNRGLVPPDVVRQYSGGSTVAAGGGRSGGASKRTTNITNIVDPRLIDRHLASSAGKDTLLNVIGQNKSAFRRVLDV